MTETAEDLRATSDAFIRDLEVVRAMEAEKRALEPGDPQVVELSQRIEALAARMLHTSQRQRLLSELDRDQIEAGVSNRGAAPIEETARPIADILGEWRAAERQLAGAAPGSAEAVEAEALADHLRIEYRRAFDRARA